MPTLQESKQRLDVVINKARVDLYKPIHIAEVLRHSRLFRDVDITNVESFRNPSLKWRDEVTSYLLGKVSSSSARYQHDVWNKSAMSPDFLEVLNGENIRTRGAVEKYIYLRFAERQGTIHAIISTIASASPESFHLNILLEKFVKDKGIRRSIDKAYEIIAYSLFETIVVALEAVVQVKVSPKKSELLAEFEGLVVALLGVSSTRPINEMNAHIFRVGVTNAADRGLDMWANFGPAIQVKHLSLDDSLANSIVDQVESDAVVIVCRDADSKTIQTLVKQIGWGRRVRGIIQESELIALYEKCLRGKFANQLAIPLLNRLSEGFKAEFPHSENFAEFMKDREYRSIPFSDFWSVQ